MLQLFKSSTNSSLVESVMPKLNAKDGKHTFAFFLDSLPNKMLTLYDLAQDSHLVKSKAASRLSTPAGPKSSLLHAKQHFPHFFSFTTPFLGVSYLHRTPQGQLGWIS